MSQMDSGLAVGTYVSLKLMPGCCEKPCVTDQALAFTGELFASSFNLNVHQLLIMLASGGGFTSSKVSFVHSCSTSSFITGIQVSLSGPCRASSVLSGSLITDIKANSHCIFLAVSLVVLPV